MSDDNLLARIHSLHAASLDMPSSLLAAAGPTSWVRAIADRFSVAV